MLPFSKKANFAHTQPALSLVERIAACVHHKEPVLLVGETGTGKTSAVQYLAQQIGKLYTGNYIIFICVCILIYIF